MTPGLIRRSARKALQQSSRGRAYLETRRERLEGQERSRGISFYRGFVEPQDLCFDVGANVGHRTELLRGAGARVVAVEPQKACAEELRRRFGDDSDVVLVASAVGSAPGSAEIAVCDEDTTISTMSSRWRSEGRFADRSWSRTEQVPVTTMDQLIAEHGTPRFCKIDVEGFERQVLEGLSGPLPCVSFEFTREFLDDARACVSLLEALGSVSVNTSFGETMQLDGGWREADEIFSLIERQPGDRDWGDIYVRSRAEPDDSPA
jgi:FkbM family methyltransferase